MFVRGLRQAQAERTVVMQTSGERAGTPSPQCSFSFGRTIWFTWPITINETPRHQP
jgi:hypothetical protein